MASPSVKRTRVRQGRRWRISLHQVPLGMRRFAATMVEVSLVMSSALVPYSLGLLANTDTSQRVPLNPLLGTTQETVAQTLALPQRDQQPDVAPLANLLWSVALITPTGVIIWQLFQLGKTGKTPPKRWLGVQVVTETGDEPGFSRALVREGLGRWGIPVTIAYLIWRYTGAFPDLGILMGLSALCWLGENAIALFHPLGRSFHDLIAGTYVVDGTDSWTPYHQNYRVHSPGRKTSPVTLEIESDWTEDDDAGQPHRLREFTTIVLTPDSFGKGNFWFWLRRHPGLALLLAVVSAMVAILGTFVGTQVYIQSQANNRNNQQQNNKVFLALVEQLGPKTSQAVEERRSAIVAMARLNDARALPFLVDLLSSETNPLVIDAIQQGLVGAGTDALQPLLRLNLSLENDRKALANEGDETAKLIALRQRATQQAIAKILALYPTQVHTANLNRVVLSQASTQFPFTLILDNLDLSGIQLKGATLSKGSFQNSRFYSAGNDQRIGTFDDWISNFDGADLKEANFRGANFTRVSLVNTNLIRANFQKANLSESQLFGSNLSSANLSEIKGRKASLENASLTGANLNQAVLSQANLIGVKSSRTSALGTDFSFALLMQSTWDNADLTNSNFQNANLQEADFRNAKLAGSNLNYAQLQLANFQNANLTNASFNHAQLHGADLKGAIFVSRQNQTGDQFITKIPVSQNSNRFQNADFSQAKNLDIQQLKYICSQGAIHPRCTSEKSF